VTYGRTGIMPKNLVAIESAYYFGWQIHISLFCLRVFWLPKQLKHDASRLTKLLGRVNGINKNKYLV